MPIKYPTKGGSDGLSQEVNKDLVPEPQKRDKLRAKKKHYLKRRMAAMQGG